MFKLVLLFGLAAVAYGAPEPQFGILMDPHATVGMKKFGNGAVVPEDTASVKAKKVEHSMAKAKALDMSKMVVYGMPTTGLVGSTGLVGTYGLGLNTIGYSLPSTFGTTHMIGKREAESDPFYTTYSSGLINPYYGYGGYGLGYGGYHMIAKREAESDPYFYSAGLISNPYYGYSTLGGLGYSLGGVRMIGKREADSDSDSQWYGYGLGGFGYTRPIYNRGIYGGWY